MASALRFIVILPLLLALVSFVLNSLTLFAGHKQGFMEDYAVVRLNTSMIGHTFLQTAQGDKSKDKDKSKQGALGELEAWWDSKKKDAKDKVNEVAGSLTDRLTDKLGVSDWYSLHIMDSCQGMFAPDPTALNPTLNTTNCTVSSPDNRLNLTHILDQELNLGPLHLSLADINWPESLQDMIDTLNNALFALFVVYVLAMGLSGLSMLLQVVAVLAPGKPVVALANLALASLAGLVCLIGSIITTVAGSKAAKHITERGTRVGISAERGNKFYILGWIATGFMLVVAVFWLGVFLTHKRRKNRGEKEG
ncbi:hypothetical protein HIM_01433 [Hirsutella minnesotensis 3608]|nr:hypothetical protein HIM_01433 [Hirsutella minnesotensis 3608]